MGKSQSKVVKSQSKVVWFDPNVFNKQNTGYFEEIKEGLDIQRFDDVNRADEYLSTHQENNCIVISSGSKGK
jgi:hypothetical protein